MISKTLSLRVATHKIKSKNVSKWLEFTKSGRVYDVGRFDPGNARKDLRPVRSTHRRRQSAKGKISRVYIPAGQR